MNRSFFYIIVGVGPDACAAAWRRVKDRAARVLPVQYRPAKTPLLAAWRVRMPAVWMRGVAGNAIIRMFGPVPRKHLIDRAWAFGQAAILRCGSSANVMAYTCGRHPAFDNWDRILGGHSGWAIADMLPRGSGRLCSHRMRQPAQDTRCARFAGYRRVGHAFHATWKPSRASDGVANRAMSLL